MDLELIVDQCAEFHQARFAMCYQTAYELDRMNVPDDVVFFCSCSYNAVCGMCSAYTCRVIQEVRLVTR